MSADVVMPPAALAAPLPLVAETEAGTVRVARTPAEVELLRDRWAQLPWVDLEADIDFFLTIERLRDDILRPHVLVLERDGEVRAMAMGRVELRDVGARVGARRLPTPRLRCVTIVHGGVAVRDAGAHRALADALWQTVRSGEAEAVFFHKAAVDGPLTAVRELWPRALRPTVPPPSGHWHLRLPATFEEYVAGLSSRTRRSVRKQARVLEEQHGDRLEVRRYTRPAEIEALIGDLEAIAARSYQRGLGGGFRADAEQRALLELGLERGWVRAWVLHVAGVPVAYELGHRFRSTFFGASTGFDPDWAQLRVGTYVQMRMVEDLCAEEGVATIDLGYGDADYKSSFAHDRSEDADITLLGPRPRALLAGSTLAVAAKADGAARRLLGQGRAMAWLRRRRRERAARRAADAASA